MDRQKLARDHHYEAHRRACERFKRRAEEQARAAAIPVLPPGASHPDPEIAAWLEPIETAPAGRRIWMVSETRKNYYGHRPPADDPRRIRWWMPPRGDRDVEGDR